MGRRRKISASFHLTVLLLSFVLCLSPLAISHAATLLPAETPDTGTVTILKQFGSTHDVVRKKTEETFLVEVIRDMQGLKKGLSYRESMQEGNGMLFVLDASQEHAFWMKGMRFPLDIIFIGGDRQITEILENLQPCEQCPLYFPKKRPAYALEINGGLTKRLGIRIGDSVDLPDR